MKLYLKKIIDKFKYPLAGFRYGIQKDRSIQIQCFFGFVVVLAGFLFSLTIEEWCIIIVSISLVIAFEFVNSAFEHAMDMISPEYHPSIKIIKDYAATAVLIVSVMAAIVGVIIFGGKLI